MVKNLINIKDADPNELKFICAFLKLLGTDFGEILIDFNS